MLQGKGKTQYEVWNVVMCVCVCAFVCGREKPGLAWPRTVSFTALGGEDGRDAPCVCNAMQVQARGGYCCSKGGFLSAAGGKEGDGQDESRRKSKEGKGPFRTTNGVMLANERNRTETKPLRSTSPTA